MFPQNEIRMMLSFMQPKYFMPVHGEYLMLKEHAKIASETGVKKKTVLFSILVMFLLSMIKEQKFLRKKFLHQKYTLMLP